MFIYKTTNLINGKIYVGQSSKDIDVEYFGSGRILLKAIKKYGKENFIREIIEVCCDKNELNNKEIFWINELKSCDTNIGYNISIGGEGGNLGEEVNKKISEKSRIRMMGNSIRKGMTAPNKGVPMSEEQKKKLRKPKTEEHKKKLSDAKIGKGLKKIICLNDGTIFNSVKEAAKILLLTEPNIVAVLKNRAEKTKGYKFEYYE